MSTSCSSYLFYKPSLKIDLISIDGVQRPRMEFVTEIRISYVDVQRAVSVRLFTKGIMISAKLKFNKYLLNTSTIYFICTKIDV